MKRKPNLKPVTETESEVIDSELVVEAQSSPVVLEKLKVPAKCEVCGDVCAPNSTEGLCWVCRRLKISAWRDSDPQMTAQE